MDQTDADNDTFWALVDQANQMTKTPLPLPILRAFVMLGHNESEVELRHAWQRVIDLENENADLKATVGTLRLAMSSVTKPQLSMTGKLKTTTMKLKKLSLKSERHHVLKAVIASNGDVAQAAQSLDTSPATVYRRLPRAISEYKRMCRTQELSCQKSTAFLNDDSPNNHVNH